MKYLHFSSKIVLMLLAIHRMDAVRFFTVELLDGNLTSLDDQLIRSLDLKVYDRKFLYADFIIKRDITEFDINITMDVIRKDNRPTGLMNTTLRGCEALAGNQRANLLKIIYGEVFRVTNLPKKCPVLKDKLYMLKNYTVKDDDFPVITPIMAWQMRINFLIGKKAKAIAILNGRMRKL